MKPPQSISQLPESAGIIRPQEAFRKGIDIDIQFGMPRHNCRFHGICNLEVVERWQEPVGPLPFGRGKGWLFIPQPNYCLICIDKNSLNANTKLLQFQQEYFVLHEAVSFSGLLVEWLGQTASLLPGRYRIMDKTPAYAVLFDLLLKP